MMRPSLPLLTLLLLTTAAQAMEPALVTTPRAQPLPAGGANHPFLAADQALQPVNLAARGYVESEFAVAGRANIYEWDAAIARVRTADVPYATRMLVRRPQDVARFSGRVIVELLDAAPGFDTAPLWGLSWEYFTRRGDAWVGVTVSPVAAAALRRFDKVRYGSMTFGFIQPAQCRDGLADAESGLAWDVIAQVGALLRSSSKENPLLVLNPQRIIAAGFGQSGGDVLTYANALHAGLRLGDGAPVYDGFLSAASAGVAPINQCAAALPANDTHRKVLPRDVPFVSVRTASDALRAAQMRDDGDVFREFDIVGAARSAPAAGQPAAADLTTASLPPPAEEACRGPRAGFSAGPAFNAIWQQYEDLLLQQMPMNREPLMVTDADAALRDDARPRLACSASGPAQPMTPAALKARYHTRAEYLRRFNAAVDEALRQRRLVAEDAAALKLQVQRTAPAF